ncbi:16S rRNA (cytidine(1402)-2'-O)-methyltransferase [Candidatus Curtissbacteria bacterium RIFCSPLOWO2_01_FULL_41_18]|uniref:Ribosomal RNA small subunit methyltransferase I n=1 Tax=Candidatus Curtissbacteria bacterium RIFCSPLOWO2_01_FULL_41_18 TaxID=1797727 RepID=A0A1F5HMM7_9BACT|nr:MAG: 16S rRNA (cytidine(1402)-2'-O)-methyltransferase [Candidatus Curtissbacteria bacterium RIFCSPLOWO2_01_FULL_41_18]
MGVLFIVATPIGNLGDITLRAIESLKSVDYVLCEDTRVTAKLLNHFGISKKMVSFNDFNEDQKMLAVISDLTSGKNIALVSDAGTPLISDPGYKLVRTAIHRGIRVESIPGPTSITTALTLSGLPPDKFTFLGYLPKQGGKRLKMLEAVRQNQKNLKSTTIIFESPFRVLKTLESIKDIFGDIDVVVCRELTKLYEEIRREKVSQSIAHFSQTKPKGEFVILF